MSDTGINKVRMVMHNLLFKKIIVLLIIVTLLSLIALNGYNFYQFLTDKSETPVHQSPVTSLKSKLKKIPPPKTIARWHLMGEKKSNKLEKAPKTTLKLNLIGIISSTSDGQARAIIEISPRKQQYFKVGDEIKKNVKVKSINADHIVIYHNLRDEIVPLKSLKSKNPIIKKVTDK